MRVLFPSLTKLHVAMHACSYQTSSTQNTFTSAVVSVDVTYVNEVY